MINSPKTELRNNSNNNTVMVNSRKTEDSFIPSALRGAVNVYRTLHGAPQSKAALQTQGRGEGRGEGAAGKPSPPTGSEYIHGEGPKPNSRPSVSPLRAAVLLSPALKEPLVTVRSDNQMSSTPGGCGTRNSKLLQESSSLFPGPGGSLPRPPAAPMAPRPAWPAPRIPAPPPGRVS